MPHIAKRYHDICAGHRVYGHENKCSNAHGHNYRIHFTCESAGLDSVGRVIDFSVMKSLLCNWLEDNWDHKFLLWEGDPWIQPMNALDPEGLVILPVNPTAENLAEYLVNVIGPSQLDGTGIVLTEVNIEETRKCSAAYSKPTRSSP